MLGAKAISGFQFACFRIIFGIYLLLHFINLIPYAGELFSKSGAFPDASLAPTYVIFPNFLLLIDSSPELIQLFISLLVVFSFFIIIGYRRRLASIVVWYGWACLLNRDPLISNPGIPYVGLILLLMSLVPPGEALSKSSPAQKDSWYFPQSVYTVAWILLAVGYTFSGVVKLASPSWVDGTALAHLASNPLARPGFIRELFLSLPTSMIAFATYFSLAGEILFLPLSLSRKMRFLAWSWMVIMHLGILCMVAFADLTAGMLMIHLFLFDPDWLAPRKDKKGQLVLFFDGVCGLCNHTVTTLIDEDRAEVLKFSSLQGEAVKPFLSSEAESIIVVDNYGSENPEVLRGSSAVFRALDAIGGISRIVALLRFIPRPIRDWGYYLIARNRYRFFGKSEQCRMITPEVRARFID